MGVGVSGSLYFEEPENRSRKFSHTNWESVRRLATEKGWVRNQDRDPVFQQQEGFNTDSLLLSFPQGGTGWHWQCDNVQDRLSLTGKAVGLRGQTAVYPPQLNPS